jgi:nucleoside-diphosphate-sugar epimerase
MSAIYKIGISSAVYLEDGAVIITPRPDSDLRALSRRISRVKTLDGGVVVTDSGYAHGDRDFIINISATKTLWDALKAIHEVTTLVYISNEEGVFSACWDSLKDAGDIISMKFIINEKVSE